MSDPRGSDGLGTLSPASFCFDAPVSGEELRDYCFSGGRGHVVQVWLEEVYGDGSQIVADEARTLVYYDPGSYYSRGIASE